MRAVLTRLEGGEALRTDSVVGEVGKMPAVGHRVSLVGQGLEFGFRSVITSTVQEIVEEGPGFSVFVTNSGSVYSLRSIPTTDVAAVD